MQRLFRLPMRCSKRPLTLRGNFFWLLLAFFLLLSFPLKAFSQEGEDFFLKVALRNIRFDFPLKTEELLVNGKVLNPQVIKGCRIKDVTPLHALTIKRPGKYLTQLRVKCEKSFLSRTLNVELFVDAKVAVLRTTSFIKRGEPLDGKVEKVELLLSAIRGKPFVGDPSKVVARVSIPSGEVVLERFVEVPFAVKRGQLVKIVAKKGGIYVETLGRALQNGRVGDIIRVKNVYSGKVIEGRVENEETVVVIF